MNAKTKINGLNDYMNIWMMMRFPIHLVKKDREWECAQWPKQKQEKNLQPKPAVKEGSVYIFCLSSTFFIHRLEPVYINASQVTTDRNMTAFSFSILLLPLWLLTAIYLSE